ncbi:MAG: hypothetical protein FWC53_03375 [Firmicutes bacterium]|nr:hypothetical protein [Bacillota bacterium]
MSKIIDNRQEAVKQGLEPSMSIEEEIERQYKLSSDDKKEIIKKIIINYVAAILIMVYFLLLIIGNIVLSKDVFVLGSKIADFVLLIITVVVLEIAYKKDSGRITVYGIELLFLSIFSLFIPYAFYELSENVKKYFMLAGVAAGAYYIVKSIIVYRLERSKYIKFSNDIKDIIKKDSKVAINFISSEIDDVGAGLASARATARVAPTKKHKKERTKKEKRCNKEREKSRGDHWSSAKRTKKERRNCKTCKTYETGGKC